jgi:hypothetical protein
MKNIRIIDLEYFLKISYISTNHQVYHILAPLYYYNLLIILIIYNMTLKNSFSTPNIFIIVSNKKDFKERHIITNNESHDFCICKSFLFIEIGIY